MVLDPPSYGTFSTPLRCQCSVFPVQKSTTEQTRSSFGGVQKFSGERVLRYAFLPPCVLHPPISRPKNQTDTWPRGLLAYILIALLAVGGYLRYMASPFGYLPERVQWQHVMFEGRQHQNFQPVPGLQGLQLYRTSEEGVVLLHSPCRKRSLAKGVWQKSDEKSDEKSIRKSDRKVTESVPKTKKSDRTPFADLLLRHPDPPSCG